ncbi:MAG: response regulator [Anaerolineae bacterium]|jgi:CheY-like chemotaxis protein
MAGERILVIDDSSELRSLLETILPFGGYRTASAGTAQEGLEKVSQLRPDLILVDLELPDTNGLKVLEELKQRQLAIPTVMMTGYGSEGVASRALHAGALGYLVKPFTTEEVLSSVEKALSVGHLHHENARLAFLVETYTRHFRAISAIGRALASGIELGAFLQRVVEAGLYVTKGDGASLLLREGSSGELRMAAARGAGSTIDAPVASEQGDPRLRAVLEEGTAVRLRAAPGGTICLQTGVQVKAVLQVPLKAEGRVAGLLSVSRQEAEVPFGSHDAELLAILADYAVLAVGRETQA